MKNVVWAIVAVGALAALVGCEDKKPEAKPSTGATAAATAHPAPARTAAPGGGW